MARPIIEYGEQRYRVDEEPLSIGRAPDNEVVIKAPGVSENHAQIQCEDGQIIIHPQQPIYVAGKKRITTTTLKENTLITIGATTFKLWFDLTASMPRQEPSGWWRAVTHPFMAVLLFCLALALPLWLGFLATDQHYVLDIRLLFYVASAILILVWILQASLLPLAKRYLFFPLLGILSVFSLTIDLTEQAAYWFNFQFNQGWFNYVSLLLSLGLFFTLLRAFLRDYVFLAGKWLTIYTLMFASPCVLAVLFVFLQNNGFYEYRRYHFPSYHSGLLPEKLDWVESKSIDDLFTFDKTE